MKNLRVFIVIIMIVAILACIGGEIYLAIKFANTPIGEIPAWVAWLLFWRNK